jgi:hypothetical protein
MKEKMKKRDVLLIAIILILLVGIVVVSGIFYFNFVVGNFGTTGHVVLNEKSDSRVDKTGSIDENSNG